MLKDHYRTPPDVAAAFIDFMFGQWPGFTSTNTECMDILDLGAGDGALAGAVLKAAWPYGRPSITCVDPNYAPAPDLQGHVAHLRNLTDAPHKYDWIVMNPPFSQIPKFLERAEMTLNRKPWAMVGAILPLRWASSQKAQRDIWDIELQVISMAIPPTRIKFLHPVGPPEDPTNWVPAKQPREDCGFFLFARGEMGTYHQGYMTFFGGRR